MRNLLALSGNPSPTLPEGEGARPFRGRFFVIAPGTGAGIPLLGGVGVGF